MTSKEAIGHWSCPLTLQQLVTDGLFPSLIRLEEGTRGKEERLSFSSGDIMALQGPVVVKDKSMVLAHYMNDTSIEDWTPTEGQGELYRALIVLPMDNSDVANLSISIFVDPSGEVYKRYISSRFSECNWVGRENELLVALGEDDDLDDIHEYLNVDDEVKKKQKIPEHLPKPTKKPRRKCPDEQRRTNHSGHDACSPSLPGSRALTIPAKGGASRRPEMAPPPPPPPRPPKSRQVTPDSSRDAYSTPVRNRSPLPSPSPTAPPTLPPRHHKSDRKASDAAVSASRLPSEGSHAQPDDSFGRDQEQSSVEDELSFMWGSGFTFADMAVPGEATYALPSPRSDGSVPYAGKLLKKVKKFMKLRKGQHLWDVEGKVKDNKSKATGPASCYQNVEVKGDSPDEQRETEDDDDSGNDEYVEIDEEMVGGPRCPRDLGAEQKTYKAEQKVTRKAQRAGFPSDKPTMRVRPQQKLPEVPGQSEERGPLSPSSLNRTDSGHPTLTPDYGGAVDPKAERSFCDMPVKELCDMSVKELCACLRHCSMSRLADVCEGNLLDGNFLHSTCDDSLRREPFCLNSFELIKLKKIREGWRPNLGP